MPTRLHRLLGDGPFHKPGILIGGREGRAAGRSRGRSRLPARPLSLVRGESSTAGHGLAYFGMLLSAPRQRGSFFCSTHTSREQSLLIRSNVSNVCFELQVRQILVEKDIFVRGLAHPCVTGAGTGGLVEKIKEQREADEQQVPSPMFATLSSFLRGRVRWHAL